MAETVHPLGVGVGDGDGPANDNPCDRVLPVLGPQNDIVTHGQALPLRHVSAAIETVRGSTSAQPAVRLAFETTRTVWDSTRTTAMSAREVVSVRAGTRRLSGRASQLRALPKLEGDIASAGRCATLAS